MNDKCDRVSKLMDQYLVRNDFLNEKGIERSIRKITYKKSLAYRHPQLSAEWDFDGNEGFKPEHFTPGSNYRASWKCKSSHLFKAPIKERTGKNGRGCSKCKYADSSNNLAKYRPSLLEEWDYERNNAENLIPEEIAPKSTKKAWWSCKYCKASWKTQIANRVYADRLGCPKCNRQRKHVTESRNLEVLYPAIAKQWHPTKNEGTPSLFSPRSGEKMWWCCNICNYAWQALIQSRTTGRGCPKCAGKIVTKGTSFAGKYPELLKYWDPAKNHTLKPDKVSSKSKKIISWKCDKNEEHAWEAPVRSIANGSRCPHCVRKKRKVLRSESFEALCPEGAELWDYEKNEDKEPHQFTPQSNKKAWFKCDKHGSWESKIQNIFMGNRCKQCTAHLSIFQSRLAKIIIAELEGLGLQVHPLHKLSNSEKDECGIYLPDLLVVIELDSFQWHKDKYEKYLKKSERIISQGLTLIRIRDERLDSLPDVHCVSYNEKDGHLDICKKLIKTLQRVVNL